MLAEEARATSLSIPAQDDGTRPGPPGFGTRRDPRGPRAARSRSSIGDRRVQDAERFSRDDGARSARLAPDQSRLLLEDPLRRDRHRVRAQGQRQRGHPGNAQRRPPAWSDRWPVRCPRQDRRDGGAAGILRRRARRASRSPGHDPHALGRHPDAAPGTRRTHRAVPSPRASSRGSPAARPARRVGR